MIVLFVWRSLHSKADAVKINLMTEFPDLFGSVYLFAKKRGWNTRESVMMDINSASWLWIWDKMLFSSHQ